MVKTFMIFVFDYMWLVNVSDDNLQRVVIVYGWEYSWKTDDDDWRYRNN